MPRVIRSSGLDVTTDAGFRAFVADYETLLSDAGLVRTSDAGQIDSATVAMPATNAYAGYSMWRFSDALQASAPVFVKVRFGRGNTTIRSAVAVQVGRATDGAGNFVGAYSSELTISPAASVISPGVAPSYATHSNGFFGIAYCLGLVTAPTGVNNPAGSFFVQRTCDNAGLPTAEGAVLIAGAAAPSQSTAGRAELLQFLPSARSVSASAQLLGIAPWATPDSRVGVTPQMFQHFVCLPKCRPLVGTCGNVRGEVPRGEVFQAALVGTVPRSYIGAADAVGLCLSGGLSDIAMLWED